MRLDGTQFLSVGWIPVSIGPLAPAFNRSGAVLELFATRTARDTPSKDHRVIVFCCVHRFICLFHVGQNSVGDDGEGDVGFFLSIAKASTLPLLVD